VPEKHGAMSMSAKGRRMCSALLRVASVAELFLQFAELFLQRGQSSATDLLYFFNLKER